MPPTARHVPHVTVHARQLAPTRVNLGPLTTPFAFPSHCSRHAISGTNAIRGQTCHAPNSKPTGTAEDDTGCWPRATAYPLAAGTAPSLAGLGFYSPGVMCPVGYATACAQSSPTAGMGAAKVTGAPVPNFAFQFPLVAGETAVGCCPTGYTCAMHGTAQTCHQKITTSTALDVMTCSGTAVADVNAFQVPYSTGGGLVQTMDMWAPLMQLNQMLSDIPATTTSSSASMSSGTTSSQNTPTASSAGLTSTSGTISTSSKTSVTGNSSPTPTMSGTSTQASNGTSVSTPRAGQSMSSSASSPSASTKNVSSSSSNSINNSGNIIVTASSPSASTPTTTSSSTMAPTPVDIIANIIATLPGSSTGAIPIATASTIMHSSSYSGVQSLPSTTLTPTPTPSATPAPAPAPSMTTGTKVGIAFVPVAAAAMLVTFLLYRWHKKDKNDDVKKEESVEPKNLPAVPQEEVVVRSPYNEDNDPPPPPPMGGLQPNTAIVPGGGQPFDYAAAIAARRNTQMNRYNGVNPHYVKGSSAEDSPSPTVNNSSNPYLYSPHDPAVWRVDDETEQAPIRHYGDERDAAHFRDVSLDNDSPIDGTSPFRLKRGDTTKKQHKGGPSPLSHPYSNSPIGSPSSVCSEWPSSDWIQKGTKRSDSFSDSRPSRPKTGVSSIYTDGGRETRILSWYDGSAAMPPMPEPALVDKAVEKEKVKIGMQRSRSFSRPLRPRMEDTEVEEAVKAVATGKVTPPPVTKDGVAF